MIAIVVAYTVDKRVIGKDNQLPWYIPDDLRNFKKLTTGSTVIMGKNTYKSIIDRIKKPLPDRTNIVVSATMEPNDSIIVASSLQAGLDKASELPGDTYIIGGQSIYDKAINDDLVDVIYATEIENKVEGDTFFPPIDSSKWQKTVISNNSDNGYDFSYVKYTRQP